MTTLSSADQAQLAVALCATAEAMGQTLSATAAQLMAQDLADYPLPVLADALKRCRREISGRLTLAGILQRAQASDGRPGRDEAWSMALSSHDEAETAILSDEILQAMAVSRPIMEAGDKVGARMAFLSAYDRLVDEARRSAAPVRWTVSLGHDPQRRVQALEEAVRLKRLPEDYAARQIARLTQVPVTDDGRAIAGLISGTVSKPSPENRQRLAALRATIEADAAEQASRAAQAAERARRLHRQRLAQCQEQLSGQEMAS